MRWSVGARSRHWRHHDVRGGPPAPLSAAARSPDERPSRETLLARLEASGWTDAWALKRLMEAYKDLAFPTASFIFGMLGVPVGIVS